MNKKIYKMCIKIHMKANNIDQVQHVILIQVEKITERNSSSTNMYLRD